MNIYDITIPIVGLITLSVVTSIIVCQKSISIDNTVRLSVIMGIIFAIVCLVCSNVKAELWDGIIALFSAMMGFFARGFAGHVTGNSESKDANKKEG